LITSNVARVLDRLQGFREKLPGEIAAAFNPSKYQSMMLARAEAVLTANAVENEPEMIQAILKTLKSGMTQEGGMFFQLGGKTLETLLLQKDPTQLGFSHRITDEALLDWVENFKELKGPRDFYQTDAADGSYKVGDRKPYKVIANQVLNAIRSRPEVWFSTSEAGKGALNPEGLVQVAGLLELSADRASTLLALVLEDWTAFMRETLPQIVAQRIRKAWSI
jgi:hypothetical protein